MLKMQDWKVSVFDGKLIITTGRFCQHGYRDQNALSHRAVLNDVLLDGPASYNNIRRFGQGLMRLAIGSAAEDFDGVRL